MCVCVCIERSHWPGHRKAGNWVSKGTRPVSSLPVQCRLGRKKTLVGKKPTAYKGRKRGSASGWPGWRAGSCSEEQQVELGGHVDLGLTWGTPEREVALLTPSSLQLMEGAPTSFTCPISEDDEDLSHSESETLPSLERMTLCGPGHSGLTMHLVVNP